MPSATRFIPSYNQRFCLRDTKIKIIEYLHETRYSGHLRLYASDSANNENCYYEVIDASAPSCHYIDADFTPPSIDNSAEKALITRNAASYFPGPQLEHRGQRQRIISALLLTVGTPFEEPYAKRVITDILDKVLLSLRRRLGGSEGVVEEIWVLCCWSPPKLWDELNCSLTLGRMSECFI
ncbi:BZ3500_MvSof-1268-A1-R1_Chr2-1g04309 [Microbotryum saponariae]|uniref:BZ3500_MvSof-1268-A1-R1_Chr2-1g04309 protein n=1 Tax=Microbotryum saponariae TaxID=289078 RepID=A0A2X0KDG1_9BASI|nr:BZ3500_MvSof-1268-A1-R1_Chr2-1g04309 [Microbotryum saponariae]SCZ91392.1 BZ3501_MvSof-1269-A2-R1_Chr2-1g03965 [Microbotryum saponariae]